MLPTTHLIDAIGTSYLDLLAAAAGCTIARPSRDYGVDGTLHWIDRWTSGAYVPNTTPVDFQLKTTTRWQFVADSVIVAVPARAYNLIRHRLGGLVPLYLIVICLEPDDDAGVNFSPAGLSISGSAYWWKDAGELSSNKSAVTLRIPRANALTPKGLEDIVRGANLRVG